MRAGSRIRFAGNPKISQLAPFSLSMLKCDIVAETWWGGSGGNSHRSSQSRMITCPPPCASTSQLKFSSSLMRRSPSSKFVINIKPSPGDSKDFLCSCAGHAPLLRWSERMCNGWVRVVKITKKIELKTYTYLKVSQNNSQSFHQGLIEKLGYIAWMYLKKT